MGDLTIMEIENSLIKLKTRCVKNKSVQKSTANQDVHALPQKSRSILSITPFQLKLDTSALYFNVYV